jgi:acyl-CoA synthetase (AMP-forming)/AMP-acid ligase II
MNPLPYPPTVPNLLGDAARRFPEREFVVTGDEALTFAAVEAGSRHLAQRLLGAGVAKGTHVGLLFPQGPDFVVALLAVTRIGAVAVPLSTFLRGPELRRAVHHTDIDTLLAPASLLERDLPAELEQIWPGLAVHSSPPLFLEDAPFLRRIHLFGSTGRAWVHPLRDEGVVTDGLIRAIEREVTPADRMVIISTSGATAEPKAVVHTHGAVVRQARKLADRYELTGTERTFTSMPFFWVGGLTVVVLTHLLVGATVITAVRSDGAEMLDTIERTRPTRLLGWTLVERLRADPTFADRDLDWLADLHAPPVVPGTRHGSLGMSETAGPHTVAASSDNQADLPREWRGSFGPPIAGMEHKIVDPATGAARADGVDGEICVRGDSLMDGLYKRERGETLDADGWYHTGDGGYLRDGLLFFTGRLTEMIKTAGANVAPREVEVALEALPGVQAAFVVGVPDAARGEIVGCLVCPDEGAEVDPAAIAPQLRAVLSSFKVPRRVLVLPIDEAPWMASGKIDKHRVVELLTNEG